MSELVLIFETDPHLGTPRLRAANGAAERFLPREVNQLDEQLHSRYEVLVRDGEGTVEHKGRMLYVKKKDGDTSRQPTLEVWTADPSTPRPSPRVPTQPRPPVSAPEWGMGFLAEIDRLVASDRFRGILPVERAMLNLVRDELKTLLDKTPAADFAMVALVALLLTAEQLSRAQRPDEPRPYAYALSGIERVLNAQADGPPTPWGPLQVQPNGEPPPSWLARAWSRLTGA
jgi:hypothetical protein